MPGKLFQNVLHHLLNKIVPFLDDADPRVTAFAFQYPGDGKDAALDDLRDELRLTIHGQRTTAYWRAFSNQQPGGPSRFLIDVMRMILATALLRRW